MRRTYAAVRRDIGRFLRCETQSQACYLGRHIQRTVIVMN